MQGTNPLLWHERPNKSVTTALTPEMPAYVTESDVSKFRCLSVFMGFTSTGSANADQKQCIQFSSVLNMQFFPCRDALNNAVQHKAHRF